MNEHTRSLYADAPNPDGYQAVAGGRPTSRKEQQYEVVRLGREDAPKRDHVLLFTLGTPGDEDYFEGTIEDPVPARHYAQMLLDATDYGVVQAEANMLIGVLGREAMARLGQAEDLEPDDLVKIMSQVALRAHGPYAEAMGKSKTG